jgi:signal transduction histidine kinase/sensor domain CHASE-containing protein
MTYTNLKDTAVFILAFLLAFGIGAFISHQSNLVKSQNHSRYMLNMLHSVGRDIEKRLDRALDAALFLKNEIELHGPDDLVSSFEDYAKSMIEKIDGITNLQLAPDGIITHIYPLKGHEQALGYRFMEEDPRSSVAWDAYDMNELIILGPFELVQGGIGFVASAPVFIEDNGDKTPWGFTTVLMLMDEFISSTQLSEIVEQGLEYHISVKDALTGEVYDFSSKAFPEDAVDYHQKNIQIQNSIWAIQLYDTKAFNPYGWLGFLISFAFSTVFATAVLWLFKQPQNLRKTVNDRTKELNRQKDFQADLLNSIPMSLAVTDSSGRMLFRNQKFISSKLNGDRDKDLDCIDESSVAVFNENAHKLLLLKRELKESLIELDRHNYIELTLLKINTKDNENLDNYLWAIRDVSALQEMNQALQELSALRANIFELIPEGLAYFNQDGIIKSFNTNFVQQIFNLTQKGMCMTCVELENQINQSAVISGPIVDYSNPENNHFDDESALTVTQTVQSLNQKNRLYSKVVRFDKFSGSGGGLILLRDITEQVQVDQMKSEFLSTAAHELRTPMANIFGYLELLLKKKIPVEQQHDMLKIVYDEAERLSHILDDLLDLARIESKLSSSLNYQEHDFKQLVEDTLGNHSDYAKEHHLVLDISDNIQPLMCDSEKIKQVLHNLLSNAEKYSQANTTITLSAESAIHAELPGILFTVEDEGIGMHSHEIDRVFERFYRANENSEKPGTGLGMAIVKQVIDLHKGVINLTSEYGRGTTVSVWLPLDRRK